MASSTGVVRVTGLLLLIAAIVSPGQCLKCYNCNSDKDPSCENKPKQFSECDNLPQMKELTMGMFEVKPACLKSVVKDKSSNRRIVLRECVVDVSLMKTCDVASILKLPDSAEIEVCETCTTDLCNGGSQLLLSSAVFILPCVISLIHSLM